MRSAVGEVETLRHSEVHLVRRDGELAADGAPDLHVDLRSVEGGFVGDFDVVDAGSLEDVAHHLFGLPPEFRFVHELLAELGGIVGGEAHDILLDAEELEVFQIHLVHRVELRLELVFRAIDVGVVHL